MSFPKVWAQDAEDGFVDSEENLEEGEVCHRAVKAFSSTHDDDDDEATFLCAGALVQRPNGCVCDAWTADAEDGIPNLQLQGAVKVLDELFLHHLKESNNTAYPVAALRNFVLQCETECASYMAGQSRGFRSLKDMVRDDSIYSEEYYGDDALDGMVFDYEVGKRLYEQVARTEDWELAAEIWSFLPDPETIKECIVIKEQEQDL